MAITLDANGATLTYFGEEVKELGLLNGLVNSMGLFDQEDIPTTTASFNLTETEFKVMQAGDFRNPEPKKNAKPRSRDVHLGLHAYQDSDSVHFLGLQNQRDPSNPTQLVSYLKERLKKINVLLNNAQLTSEFVKLQALKGNVRDIAGASLVDMFSELGVTQETVDLTLGNTSINLDEKVTEIKTKAAKAAKDGGVIKGPIKVLCNGKLFSRFSNHPSVLGAYQDFDEEKRLSKVLRGNLQTYTAYGAISYFEHKGVLFIGYDPEFLRDAGDGTTESILGFNDSFDGAGAAANGVGYTILETFNNYYKLYNGPEPTLIAANQASSEIIHIYEKMGEWGDQAQMLIRMLMLPILQKPGMSIKITSSN